MKIQVFSGMKTCDLAYVYTPLSIQNLKFISCPIIFYLSNTLMQCRHFAVKSKWFDSF
jgi:hypothetical protein